uniref:NADH-ubiquinone oxidoreductase chain 5 n=1 Tax=Conchocele cf. bisecta HPD1644 TaxID=1872713 RepID=A0A1B4WRJ3_9BIVA|nr:NADH dehydrogenase subunit 5 [Conchocele cf. bisecta HPD1644]
MGVFIGGGSILSALILLFYSLVMLIFVVYSFLNSYSFLIEIVLIKVGVFSFSFPVLLSWENYMVSMVVCFISGSVLLYSKVYMEGEHNYSRFINLVCLFVLSMNLLIFIPSLMFLFLGWDGLGIVSFILVIYYQNKNSLASGMITVLTNRLGDVFLFLSITMSSCLGYWCWVGFEALKGSMMHVDFFIFALSLVVAAMTKSAQFPFCAWLPAAMAAPTPVSALVHSSTLVTAGVFLLCRFSGVLLMNVEVCKMLYLVSLLTMMMSGMVCCVEWDMKKVIAFSTLSQLGVMMFSVSLGMVNFGMFHLVTHAVFKALMFLCAGFVISYCNHSQDFRCVGGFWWLSPFMSGSLIASVFCLGGMPFLSGFYSKDLILEEFLMGNMSMVGMVCLVLATVLTICYSLRLCVIVTMGKSGLIEMKGGGIKVYYIIPMFMLEALSVIEGSLIQSSYSSYSSLNFVFEYMKKSLVFLFVVGVLIGYFLLNSKKKYFYSMMNFIYSIMFLGDVSGQVVGKMGLSMAKSSFEVLDQGLFEKILGGSGLKKLGQSLSLVTMKIGHINSMYMIMFYFIVGYSLFMLVSLMLKV